ncbi:MAG: helix-turn-helix transcriptional regulator [Flexilinea sp.]|nr:helix-turn-helix transcriptional regulator [Flexilinea sp.]
MKNDPEFRAVVEYNEPDYQIMRAIAGARAKTGMTQKELSEKSGVIQAEISKMENGNANPSLKTLKKLAAGMNMKLVISFEPIQNDQTNDDYGEMAIPLHISEHDLALA